MHADLSKTLCFWRTGIFLGQATKKTTDPRIDRRTYIFLKTFFFCNAVSETKETSKNVRGVRSDPIAILCLVKRWTKGINNSCYQVVISRACAFIVRILYSKILKLKYHELTFDLLISKGSNWNKTMTSG